MVGRKAQDKSIILWDLGSGKSLKSFKGHSEAITSLDFSGEGSVLASGALDCSVRIWDTKTCLSNLKEGASSIDSNEASLNLVSSKSGLGNQNHALNHNLNDSNTYPTKSTPVYKVQFSRQNVLLAAGVFQP
eukprot:Sdes_comp20821_c0_seq1m17294